MSTILVTGACGFIGWKVCEKLLAGGDTVVGVDNLDDAYDVRLKQWRLAQLQGRPGFAFHRVDISDRDGVRSFGQSSRKSGRVDVVVNLAARAGVRRSVTDPWVYVAANVNGTVNLLELCRELDVGSFVLASTSSLYGEDTPAPFREDADTSRPLSPYAASKKAAEAMAYSYHSLHGLDVTVLRFFTVYGPAGRPDMSLFRFVQWISEGREVVVFGDGTQRRDFTYVGDVANGVRAALTAARGYEIINLGSDKPIVLNDAIRLIEQLVGREAAVRHEPRHPADVEATWADISKARRLLGWQPETDFAAGVGELVDWYRRNRDWARDIVT
ncbi:MAG: SDR family NAD(P)-dependent oxidoreductase [Deltaproteobacteria bacterium]|nr:SDR family NAD(P)-dependent oxidoreductase [Deltaproteobacteria bacterium]